jgi:hypothetical protein
MKHRFSLLLLLCIPAAGCFQELDTGADKGSKADLLPIDFGSAPDPGDGGIPTLTETPPIQVVTDLGAGVDKSYGLVSDVCKTTTAQATWILGTYCGACHETPNKLGLPAYDYILDFNRLMDPASETDLPNVRFLVRGDPANSRIYQRVSARVGKAAMPPISNDSSSAAIPRPTISDVSVLQEWIKSCL